MEHFKVACEPFYYEKIDIYTGGISKIVKEEDKIDEEKALLHLVGLFIK